MTLYRGVGIFLSFRFHELTSLYPPSFKRNDFSTCSTHFSFWGKAQTIFAPRTHADNAPLLRYPTHVYTYTRMLWRRYVVSCPHAPPTGGKARLVTLLDFLGPNTFRARNLSSPIRLQLCPSLIKLHVLPFATSTVGGASRTGSMESRDAGRAGRRTRMLTPLIDGQGHATWSSVVPVCRSRTPSF